MASVLKSAASAQIQYLQLYLKLAIEGGNASTADGLVVLFVGAGHS